MAAGTARHRTLAGVDAALDRFRRRVIADPRLQQELLAEDDPHRFAVRVVALAAVEGIDVDVDVVDPALREARDRRLQRWL